jgi:DNA polymerase I-like protein with 3'-5' exonuclease and polymerase domains
MPTKSNKSNKSNKSSTVAEKARALVASAPVVGFDLETTGLDPRSASVRLVQVSDGDKTYILDAWRLPAHDLRGVLLELAGRDVAAATVAHGAAFEYSFVLYHYGIALDNLTDTMLLAQLLNAGDMTAGASLAVVAERYLGVKLDKSSQVSNWAADKLTKRQLTYAARDARFLPRLYWRLAGKISEAGLDEAAAIERSALPAVARMRLEGMPVDREAWDAHADENAARLKALKRQILEAPWLPDREPVPQLYALQGADCLEMLTSAGVAALEGATAKDLKPYTGVDELVDALLAWRKMPAGVLRDEAGRGVRALAAGRGATKPPLPPPPWNFGSPAQVNEICNEILGFCLESTDEAHILPFTDRHPFFSRLLEYRGLTKLVGTYGRDWFKQAYNEDTGRVYPGYRQIGTSTGRFASGEREKSPNAQNLPVDYRRFFGAPRGRALVNIDYSQIEVRVIAKVLEVEELLRLFEAGEDIYRNTAAGLLGLPVADVDDDQRQLAKALVLGMIYGLSAHGLPMYAYKNFGIKDMSPKEASSYVDAFYALYPEIEEYHDDVLGSLRVRGEVDQRTITGRLRAGITNRNEAINAPIQGSAADGLKAAMAAVYPALRARVGESAFIIATLHDELLIECDEGDGEAVLELVSEVMVETMDELINKDEPKVPIKAEGRVTKIWIKD